MRNTTSQSSLKLAEVMMLCCDTSVSVLDTDISWT